MRSRVTTKKGDTGSTITISGDRYPKSHPVLECCGQLDVLRAETALLRLEIMESDRDDSDDIAPFLFWLLHVYFLIGTECNDPFRKHPEYRQQEVGEKHLATLESFQEGLESELQLPNTFIVSAANTLSAKCDLLATTTRSFELSAVHLNEQIPAFHALNILAFTNRLSDFFFVLARTLDNGRHTSVDYSVLDNES